MDPFDLPGVLRRIRRRADLSQRDLARACAVSVAVVSHAEAGRRGMTVELLTRAAALAGLRLGLVDEAGAEVTGMADGAVRDRVGRRFPAHLDTRDGDVDWWHGDERYSRAEPWYTFDRKRATRDEWRRRTGTPEDHQLPLPGDSPTERRARRREAGRRRREEELRRRREAGEFPERVEWTCACPAACDDLDIGERPQHAEDCPCGCDVD